MRRKELSERIERHMERGEELMELNRTAFQRNEAAFQRNTQAFERLVEAFDRFEKSMDEQQIFIRDMNCRNEVVLQQVICDHQEFMEKLTARDEKAEREEKRKTDLLLAEMREAREESKAQREALLALIDRLPPPAQAA
jgi:type I restriction-modification system DNA methylase subunit